MHFQVYCIDYYSNQNLFLIIQGLKGGSLEPWSFCFGARSPIILLTGALILFCLWSLKPKEIFCGSQNPAFWNLIIRDPRLHFSCFMTAFCLFDVAVRSRFNITLQQWQALSAPSLYKQTVASSRSASFHPLDALISDLNETTARQNSS